MNFEEFYIYIFQNFEECLEYRLIEIDERDEKNYYETNYRRNENDNDKKIMN